MKPQATIGDVPLVAVMCLLLAAPAWAQTPTSGIAGAVRDDSGGVLPGVTVEAASPVLIEKVRSVSTDGQGRYNIVDLRPGAYTVTFSLAGFSNLRREGVVLPSGFTATVNAELKVGALAETITVTGEAPQVDTQNVRQQLRVSEAALTSLPVGSGSLMSLVALAPGLTAGGAIDVGGTAGHRGGGQANGLYHGKHGIKTAFDGMRTQNTGTGQAPGYVVNSEFVEEVSIETGGISAEGSSTGMAMNLIPKEGSNTFRFSFSGKYTNDHLQSNNLSDELRARGVATPGKLLNLYDSGGYVGGPIRRDRLWFYGGVRRWGLRSQLPGLFYNKTQGTMFYTPDLNRPASSWEVNESYGSRLTWQVSTKNKASFFLDIQHVCSCLGINPTAASAPEANAKYPLWPNGILQGTWQSPVTSKLLFEAGAGWMIYRNAWDIQPEGSWDAISILETSTNFRYNAATAYSGARGDPKTVDRSVQRASLTYVTGSHSFKVGEQEEYGWIDRGRRGTGPNGGGVSYRFLKGVPQSIDLETIPYIQKATMKADMGIFAQDQWTIKRLTLNYGLRFDWVNGYVPAQTQPASQFVPERSFEAVRNVPNYKDFNPRLGVSYNLFGDGRTALKLSVGRYGDLTGVFFTQLADPLITSVTTANRPWTDTNGNYVPDCDLTNFAANLECGPISNQNFGKSNPNATRFSDDVIRGWNARKKTWDVSTEVEHQIITGLSVKGGYYHNWDGNLRVLRNLEVTPADFDPYCITTPVDAQLPGGGGQQVCGLYDVRPAKSGKVINEWTQSSNFGDGTGTTRRSDFLSATMNVRRSGFDFGGGVDTGRTVTDNCFVVDSPQTITVVETTSSQRVVDQRFCHEVLSWLGNLQVKFNGTAPLPSGFALSATFQDLAGAEILGDYVATSAEIAPSLGRPLSGGRRTVNVALIAPHTQFEKRRRQLDLRVSKAFNVSSKVRLEAKVDLYNVLNANTVLTRTDTLGPNYGRPTSILPARMIHFGGGLTF